MRARDLGALVLAAAMTASAPACEQERPPARTGHAGAGTGTGMEDAPEATKPAGAAPAEMSTTPGLAAALRHGVTPPTSGGSTYYIDPFLLTLLVEQARADALSLSAIKTKDGRAALQVETVRPGGLLAALGLKSGDQIVRVNESSLEDPAAAVPGLAAAGSRLVVELLREDYSMTLEYRLVGGMAWSRTLAAYGGVLPGPANPPVLAPVPPTPPPEAAPDSGNAPASDSAKPAPKPTVARPPAPTPAGGSSGVTCSSQDSCEISRSRFDALVKDPEAIDRQASIVPAIRNDVQSGYKLKTVRAGTDIYALGFRSGDKITRINGHFLGDDAQAMALYFKLSATRVFDIRYERGGRALRKVVRVK